LRRSETPSLVVDRLPGFGVQTRDVLSVDAALIAGINFRRTATRGLTLASRLLPVAEFRTTSGTALPITEEKVLLEIGRYLRRTAEGQGVPKYATRPGVAP
jgi:hypothetical protein